MRFTAPGGGCRSRPTRDDGPDVGGLFENETSRESNGSAFAWVFDRGQPFVYSEGALVETRDLGLPALTRTALVTELGRDLPGVREYLRGSLDDIRVYDRALTGAEVQIQEDIVGR